MTSFKKIIEDTDTRAGRLFDAGIQALIILSIVSFSIETLPNLSGNTIKYLSAFEVISVSIFTFEYISRVVVSTKKLKFIFSFFGIIDFLAILPFYLTTGLDLRSLRSFRLLRVIRILKIARYTSALTKLKNAFILAKEELVIFFFMTLIILYLAGVGIYYFENAAQPEAFSSVFQSLWWAVATLTTVGYGDIYPITVGGKIFTFLILMIGLGIVAVPAGIIASSLSKAIEQDHNN